MTKLSPPFLLTVFGLCSALLGTVYFVYYFHVIGRPDLVMSFFSNDISVFYVFFALLIAGFLATVLQLMPSVLVCFAFNVARWNGIEAKKASKFSFLLLSFGVGFVFLIGLVGFWVESSALYTRVGLIVFFVVLLTWSMSFFYKNRGGYNGHESVGLRVFFSSFAMVGIGFGGLLFFVVIILNILRYGATGEGSDYFPMLIMGAFVLLVSIFPGMAWISLREEGVKKQVKFSAAVGLSVLFLIIMLVPDLLKVVTFNTGKIVGLHSDVARYYVFNGDEIDVARTRLAWPKGGINDEGVVVGKQLFNLGGKQLICPSRIVITAQEMLVMEGGVGADCMMFSNSQLVKGDLALENPGD